MRHADKRTEDLVLELWSRTRIDWGFASSRIAEVFRRERRLGSSQRRDVAETLYGMIRMARRVDFALGLEGGGAGGLPAGDVRERARLFAYRVLEGELGLDEARAALPEVDWTRVTQVDERIARERDAVRQLGLRRSLPDWLARRLLVEYDGEADALAAALNERAPLTLRANVLRLTREELSSRLAADGLETRPTRHAKDGLVLETRTNVFGLRAFKEGLFEAQDEASQLVAEITAPPRDVVVDACAGAGGKTLALGALMGSRGRLFATDVDARKLDELRRRARRAGLSNVRAAAMDGAGWPDEIESLRGRAARVLVDAPCTGMGALRRNPEARWRLAGDALDRLPEEQLRILSRAADLVAPGGRLVYATCTIFRAENQDVVEAFLRARPDFEPVRVVEILGKERGAPISDPTGTWLTMLPHRHGTDGFFGAVLRRTR